MYCQNHLKYYKFNKHLNCEKCVDLKLQLLQALNELSSAPLIVDLLNKEYNCKQDKQTFNIVRNDYWTQVKSNYQKRPKNLGENSTHYIPTTINHFELLSTLLKMQTIGQERIQIKNHITTQDVYKESFSQGNHF